MKETLSIFLAASLLLLHAGWKSFENRPISDNSGYQFIENKGQWNNNIEFLADVPNGKLYLRNDGFSYLFYHPDDIASQGGHGDTARNKGVMRYHVFTIDFLNATKEKPRGSRAYEEYHNYFHGNDRSKWASHVPLYREVEYKSLYPKIAMSLYGDDYILKYDFIVDPGGDVNDIQMQYKGLNKLYLKNGALHVVTSVNEIIEQQPYAFQVVDGQKVQVPCEFVISEDVVSFNFPKGYNKEEQLIIDPRLIFSTFSGSIADNWGFTATFDSDGLVYSGGIAFGPGYQDIAGDTLFLPTAGAYQDTFAGGTYLACDMAIIKYTASGSSRIYSTYLGGTLNECPHSLVAKPSGELLILGTTSSSNFPTTLFAYDSTFNGGTSIISSSSINYIDGSDMVVAKLSWDGIALVSSTYIGGTGNDGLNVDDSTRYNYGDDFRGEIIVDGSGDCYIASTTTSTDFPMINSFQATYGGGDSDGITFKLSSNFSNLIWSSYLGGSASDAAYAVQFDLSNDVYVCGGTTSGNFPTSSGALNPISNGGVDGFVVHISNDGSNLIGSTYLGTSAYDQCYFVQLDSSENVYVVGQTMGTYPVIPDSIIGSIYSNAGGKQFIHKLNNDLSETAFSTVYGTGGTVPDISPSAFLVNNCGNIFISGWGGATGGQQGSTTGLPTTPNAEQLTTDGNDFHLMVLFNDAISVLYATYFGGPSSNEHVDGGTSRFDKNGIVYQSVCGGCGGKQDYPTTPGAWSNTNNSTNCNNAVFKLDMADLDANFLVLPQSDGCVDFTATFQNESTGGLTYYWDFGDGTTSTTFNGTHTYIDTGKFDVLLVITDSTTCRVQDSAFSVVTVYPNPVTSTSPDVGVCPGDSTVLTASGGVAYIWSLDSSLSCQFCPSPYAYPDTTTVYFVTVIDNNTCQTIDSVTVSILPTPIAAAGFDIVVCPGDSVQLNALGGVAYSWSPDSTLINPTWPNPTASPSVTTDYIVTVYDNMGCSDQDTLNMAVQDSIIADAGPSGEICLGDSASLLASGGANYSWSPTTGLSDPNIANPNASPSTTTMYYITVGSAGCSDVDSVQVLVNALPLADAGSDVTICEEDTVVLTAAIADNYLWNTLETTSSIEVHPEFTSTYSVVVTDLVGCKDSDEVVVAIQAPPVITATPAISTICSGEFVTLDAIGGSTYVWSTMETGASISVNPTDTAVYYVTGYDALTCSGTDTVVVNVIPFPVAIIDIVGDEGCVPFQVDFENYSTPEDFSLSYFWDFGDPASGPLNIDSIKNPSHLYNSSGTFTVTLDLAHAACTGLGAMTASTTVTVNSIPNASFTAYPYDLSAFDPVTTITDKSSGGDGCLLIFANGDTVNACEGSFTITDTGLVTIMQIVFDGACSDTTYEYVYLKPQYIFFAPNTFTPNGDGNNDFFFGKGIGIIQYEMYIYDRWGDQIFKSTDIEIGWDGHANEGKNMAQEDVYVYLFKITDFRNLPHVYIGHITVLR